MSAPQGTIYFSGITSLLSGQFTVTTGISPSVCRLVIPPQAGRIPLSGDLLIEYGTTRMVWPDCRVDQVEDGFDPSGVEVVTLTILDRRWMWRECGIIGGFYNTRRGDAHKIVPGTEATPKELVTLCLDAMGEKDYDIRKVPNEARPEVSWDATNPAEALAQLCDALGCRVTLNRRNRVEIWPVGEGKPLPTTNVLDGALVVDPPDPPGRIVIVGARRRWQVDLRLDPVGLESTGEVKAINELSYAPVVNGRRTWQGEDIDHFNGVKDVKKRELAQQSVFRWYRIRTPFDLLNHADNPIADLDRILPLESAQVETLDVFGREERRPPWVWGKFYSGHEAAQPLVPQVEERLRNEPRSRYTQGFSLNSELGIVVFNEPVFLFELLRKIVDGRRVPVGMRVLPAVIWLRVSVNLREKNTRAWIRPKWVYAMDQARGRAKKRNRKLPDQVPAKYVLHEDVILEEYRDWDAARGGVIKSTIINATKQARYYFNAERLKYQFAESGSLSYAGLVDLELDGAIQQISWIVTSEGFAITRVSRNREEVAVTPSYAERRMIEKIQAGIAAANAPDRVRQRNLERNKG